MEFVPFIWQQIIVHILGKLSCIHSGKKDIKVRDMIPLKNSRNLEGRYSHTAVAIKENKWETGPQSTVIQTWETLLVGKLGKLIDVSQNENGRKGEKGIGSRGETWSVA